MASSTSSPCSNNPAASSSDYTATTTFVQADPSTFRTVVQRLTGAPPDSSPKLPVTNNPAPRLDNMGPRRSAFKLHERRNTARKLEIKLNNNINGGGGIGSWDSYGSGLPRQMSFLASPVSTLDVFARGGSPRTPMEEEEKAIAAKGFYLHPSPRTTTPTPTPTPSQPQLLTLFPLQSSPTHSSPSS